MLLLLFSCIVFCWFY